jgi:hypothetical protein
VDQQQIYCLTLLLRLPLWVLHLVAWRILVGYL